MARSKEPIVWSLFAAGGGLSAFALPILILVTGVAVPLGWISASELRELVVHPVARLALFGVIFLSLFHWAHRFRYVLVDLGLRALNRVFAVLFYGAAIAGTILAAWSLAQL